MNNIVFGKKQTSNGQWVLMIVALSFFFFLAMSSLAKQNQKPRQISLAIPSQVENFPATTEGTSLLDVNQQRHVYVRYAAADVRFHSGNIQL